MYCSSPTLFKGQLNKFHVNIHFHYCFLSLSIALIFSEGIDSIISTDTITERNTGKFFKSYNCITIPCIDSIQSNQTNNFVQIDRNSVDVQPLVPTYLSNTTTVSNIPSVMASQQLIPAAPEIIVQPKQNWHYRSMNDLGKHENPLLAGEGLQRTHVQVKVKHRLSSKNIENNSTIIINRFL